MSTRGRAVARPTFEIVFLFHANFELFARTLPRCLEALTAATEEAFDVVIHCDGSPPDVVAQVVERAPGWGVDEVRTRSRARWLASGDPSNNGHQRFFDGPAPYRIVVEDDVVMYREDLRFDVLASLRRLFERHEDVPVLSKVDDSEKWSWKLRDVGPEIESGVRSVNRLSTHFIAYDVVRFRSAAERMGAFEPDVFVDREDWSYNWEDVVSHVATTGGRRIAFPETWPLRVFHCDVKVSDESMYNTQDPNVKTVVLDDLEALYGPR